MADESTWIRRGFSSILNEVLEAAEGGAPKTRIMYRASLSYVQLNKYISFLQRRKLLQRVEATGHATIAYETTKKGLQYLHFHREIMKLLK